MNRPFNFDNIHGYLHDIPKNSIEKLPSFEGNNAILTIDHSKKHKNLVNNFGARHDDVNMILFSLSLEDYSSYWFIYLPSNSIRNIYELHNTIFNIWDEKKDNIHILAALTIAKKNENEIVIASFATLYALITYCPYSYTLSLLVDSIPINSS